MERRDDDASAIPPVPSIGPDLPPAMTATPTSRRALRELEGRSRRAPRPAARGVRAAPARSARRAPRPRRSLARRVGSQLLSVGAMVCAAALLVGVSIPASLFGERDAATADPQPQALAAAVAVADEQHLDVSDAAAPASLARDAYSTVSWAQILEARYATRDYSYAVGSGSIRWPFPAAVRISDGFGERIAPCRGCSSMHQGVDFLPGAGAPIFAIADGIVTDREDGEGGFGNFIIITHIVNGQKVTSSYAHMQHGSSAIQLGQQVVVGEFLGLVGSTGAATGPHLHFEIAVEDTKVDPFAWLKANAN